ncbi:hypothetical protein RDABS01_027288 [Bienertia sinuspersici]
MWQVSNVALSKKQTSSGSA